MATGRDASDVAMTTSFGQADLCNFFVVSEVEEAAVPANAGDQDLDASRSTPTFNV